MTEHFDFSPSSRKAAEKAWANAAHLDGEGGDELPSSEMGLEDGGMFSGMGEGLCPDRSRAPLPARSVPIPKRMSDGASPAPAASQQVRCRRGWPRPWRRWAA